MCMTAIQPNAMRQLVARASRAAIVAAVLAGANMMDARMATANTSDDAAARFLTIEGAEGQALLDLVATVSPTLATAYVRGGYGDLRGRGVLAATDEPLVGVAALTAMGGAEQALEVQINAAINAGVTVAELELIITQLVAYRGFHRSVDAMAVLQRVAAARGLLPDDARSSVAETDESRYAVGAEAYGALDAEALANIRRAFGDMAPDLADTTFRIFGDVFGPPGLDLRRRQIATVAALAAMGGADPQLRFHIAAAMNVGVSRNEIVEIMMLLQLHAGMPAAYNGLVAAKAVFEQTGARAPAYR